MDFTQKTLVCAQIQVVRPIKFAVNFSTTKLIVRIADNTLAFYTSRRYSVEKTLLRFNSSFPGNRIPSNLLFPAPSGLREIDY